MISLIVDQQEVFEENFIKIDELIQQTLDLFYAYSRADTINMEAAAATSNSLEEKQKLEGELKHVQTLLNN